MLLLLKASWLAKRITDAGDNVTLDHAADVDQVSSDQASEDAASPMLIGSSPEGQHASEQRTSPVSPPTQVLTDLVPQPSERAARTQIDLVSKDQQEEDGLQDQAEMSQASLEENLRPFGKKHTWIFESEQDDLPTLQSQPTDRVQNGGVASSASNATSYTD